jgi:ClpP class serine protease
MEYRRVRNVAKGEPPILQVLAERNQSHGTRKQLFNAVEKALNGRTVVSYFTSFKQPVQIDASDVDMLESVLLATDLSKGLALLISSPGGSALAAERIVNLCRQHSKTGEFVAIVPSRAKSAATMICMGASKILMGPSSELGPVDPQLTMTFKDGYKRYSVWSLVNSYKDLFAKAIASKSLS